MPAGATEISYVRQMALWSRKIFPYNEPGGPPSKDDGNEPEAARTAPV